MYPSMNFGYVNLAYMLSIYEPDITNAKEELAEKSGQTVDEITLSDDALAELEGQSLWKSWTDWFS